MKDIRMANRGMTFETFLEYTNQRYMAAGKAVVVKIPTKFVPIRNNQGRVVNVKVEEKSSVDYIGRYKSIPIAMEAKHTSSDNIRFDAVQDHQAAFLDAYTGQGDAIGIVLVSFSMRDFYAVPWPAWKAARDAWKNERGTKFMVEHYGQKWKWTTPGKASVKQSELLPEWKCGDDASGGVNYLAIIDRLTNYGKIINGGTDETI